MQSSSELLAALSKEGITLSLAGDKLKVLPRHLVTDDVRQVLVQRREQIIEELMSRESQPASLDAILNQVMSSPKLASGSEAPASICPLCGGPLNEQGLDGCWHRAWELRPR